MKSSRGIAEAARLGVDAFAPSGDGSYATIRPGASGSHEPEAADERVAVRAQPDVFRELLQLARVAAAEDDVVGLERGDERSRAAST